MMRGLSIFLVSKVSLTELRNSSDINRWARAESRPSVRVCILDNEILPRIHSRTHQSIEIPEADVAIKHPPPSSPSPEGSFTVIVLVPWGL